ncbi:hypothetical protein CAL7716_107610 (plasmid) [Calothrix sp. PCC 7716]|nr:hypothetical protein CAL7716_107610 [Calothrix sp. PCC 7716]
MKFNEALYNGLTNLGAFIKEAKQDQIEHEQSIYKTGWVSDSEKLRLMKYELFSSTRARSDSDYLFQLRCAIDTLSKEIDREHRRQNSLVNQLNKIAKSVIGLTALATVGSYAVSLTGVCNHVNSKFCRDARIIPYAIERYFYDEPSLVNPEPNVNIDQPQSFNPPPNNPRPRCLNRSCTGGGSVA